MISRPACGVIADVSSLHNAMSLGYILYWMNNRHAPCAGSFVGVVEDMGTLTGDEGTSRGWPGSPE
jgi:hypothetical protein